METFLVQDFVTIRGPGVTTVTQTSESWLRLPDVPNAVAWLQVTELTTNGGTVKMSYQTAPVEDEGMFVALAGPATTVPFAPSVGVNVTPLLKDLLGFSFGSGLGTGSPLAGFFRWQLVASGTFSGAWDITFRLWLSARSKKPARR
jgi:hypothetical protein